MARAKNLREKQTTAFLAALRKGASVSKACAAARLPMRTAYNWREEDVDFAAEWEAAIEVGTDGLEDEAIRRGRDGVNKPVYQGGDRVGYVRQYSDLLLVTMLNARRPEKFRHRASVDVDIVAGLGSRLEAAEKRATITKERKP